MGITGKGMLLISPFVDRAYKIWRDTGHKEYVVLVLQDSEQIVNLYCLSPVDAQVCISEADLPDIEQVCKMTVSLGESPGVNRFWIYYMLNSCLGLISLDWKIYSVLVDN